MPPAIETHVFAHGLEPQLHVVYTTWKTSDNSRPMGPWPTFLEYNLSSYDSLPHLHDMCIELHIHIII